MSEPAIDVRAENKRALGDNISEKGRALVDKNLQEKNTSTREVSRSYFGSPQEYCAHDYTLDDERARD